MVNSEVKVGEIYRVNHCNSWELDGCLVKVTDRRSPPSIMFHVELLPEYEDRWSIKTFLLQAESLHPVKQLQKILP